MSYNDLRKGRYSEPGREYLVTTVTARRRRIFADLWAARLPIREMRRMEEAGQVAWQAWVVMPDHLHGLVSLAETGDLAAMMNRLKGGSARSVNRWLGCQGALWQPGFHDHALRSGEDRIAVARYIVANPLRAGLVRHLGDYPHWDSVFM